MNEFNNPKLIFSISNYLGALLEKSYESHNEMIL